MTDMQGTTRRPRLPWKMLTVCVALAAALTGCGQGNQASVSGKVTYLGEPVKGGSLIFGPVGEGNVGRPAAATVQPDGTYVLGTNGISDGAIIARHRVTYSPPPQELTEQQRKDPTFIAPPPAYMGMVPKEPEMEVKAGKNVLDIELVVPPQ